MKRDRGNDDTLVDRLDMEVQTVSIVIDNIHLRTASGEPLSAEEAQRIAVVLGNFLQAYERARYDWLDIIS